MQATQRQIEIAHVAMTLFAQRGYEATTMRDVAAALDMRASSLYNHFASKHEILSFIAMRSMATLLDQQREALAGSEDPATQLVNSMRTHITFHARNKEDVQVTLQALKSLHPDAREALVEARRTYVRRWVDILRTGVTTQAFACSDIKLTAYALIDMGIGIATWYNPDGPAPLEHIATHYAALALRTVGADNLAELLLQDKDLL